VLVLMPRIFKPSTDATKPAFGDRFYYDKKLPPEAAASSAAGLPYGFRRPGYQGLPGFLGAPQQQNAKRPFENAPANVGPVASGAVGCSSCGSGANLGGRFDGMNLDQIFPGAKTGCPSCSACGKSPTVPGQKTCSKCQGQAQVAPPTAPPSSVPVMPNIQVVQPSQVTPIVPTPGRTPTVQPQMPTPAPSTGIAVQVQGQGSLRSMADLLVASKAAVQRSSAGILARGRR